MTCSAGILEGPGPYCQVPLYIPCIGDLAAEDHRVTADCCILCNGDASPGKDGIGPYPVIYVDGAPGCDQFSPDIPVDVDRPSGSIHIALYRCIDIDRPPDRNYIPLYWCVDVDGPANSNQAFNRGVHIDRAPRCKHIVLDRLADDYLAAIVGSQSGYHCGDKHDKDKSEEYPSCFIVHNLSSAAEDICVSPGRSPIPGRECAPSWGNEPGVLSRKMMIRGGFNYPAH